MCENDREILGAKIVGLKLDNNTGFVEEIFIVTPSGEKARLHGNICCDKFEDVYIGVTVQE